MSSPGIKVGSTTGEDVVRNDFAAAHAAQNYDWILHAGAGGSPPAPGGSAGAVSPPMDSQPKAEAGATPAPAPASASTPFGLYLSGAMQRLKAATIAPQAERDTTLGAAIEGGITGIPAEIGKQFMEGLRAAKRDALPANLQQLQDSLDTPIPGSKPIMDAIGAMLSPLTGTATSAVGRPVEEQTGLRRDLVGNVLAGLVPLGDFSAISDARKTAYADTVGAAVEGKTGLKKDVVGAVADQAHGAAERAPAAAAAAPAEEKTAEAPRAFDLAGEAPGAELKITPEVRQHAADFLNGTRPDNPINVSLETLANPATRIDTIAGIAKLIPKEGIKPVDVTRMNAYSIGLTPDEVMAAIRPKFPGDEMFDAAGMAMNSAGEQLGNFARAHAANPTDESREAFTRALAVTNEYIGAFRDAKTDWGRTGRIQQEVAGQFTAFTKQIGSIIDDVGPANVDQVAAKIAALGDPAKVSPFVANLRAMSTRDALLYGFYNLKLSNPRTVIKKIMSDTSVMAWNVASTYASEKLGAPGVQAGEAGALMQGYLGSFGSAMRLAGKALREGSSQFEPDAQTADGRVPRLAQLANGVEDAKAAAGDSPSWHALDYLRAATPTSWMAAADDWGKFMNYAAIKEQLIYRDAGEKGLKGDALAAHVNQQRQFTPQAMDAQARAEALRNVFQEPLSPIGEKIRDIFDAINIPVPGTKAEVPLGRMILPFVRVAANIPRFAARQTPVGFMMPSVQAELAAGGARRSLALARIGLGTGVSLTAVHLVAAGDMVGGGPSDPQMNSRWRAALGPGVQPYSVRLGGNWYQYKNWEPAGTVLGAIADTAELFKYAHNADDVAWSLVFGVGNAMLSKTYMQNISDLLEALRSPDRDAARFGDNFLGSTIEPAGASAVRSATDPWLRAHYGLLDNLEARTPGLSSTLPANQDQWGRDIKLSDGFGLPGGMGRALSPVSVAPADQAEPIDKWIWEHRSDFPNSDQGRIGLTKPGLVQSFKQGRVDAPVQLQPNELHEMRALAGDKLKDPSSGLGALGTLNALVKGNHPNESMQAQWDNASDAEKAVMVISVWNKFKGGAQRQILKEFPRVALQAQTALDARKTALTPKNAPAGAMPNLGGGP